MLAQIKAQFKRAESNKRVAEAMLENSFPVGKIVTFRKGNMTTNANAEVLLVSGRRIKIRNQFSNAERWIDFEDIQGI